MDYNTRKTKLLLKEYGRNIQNLVEYAIEIKDKDERTKTAHALVEIMGLLNPLLKNSDLFKHKLWDHLHIIADFKLDVDAPFPVPARPSEIEPVKKHLDYPKSTIKNKHYGNNVEKLIEKAKGLEDPEKQKALAEVIGNYMKLVYKNWNNENITDEAIRQNISEMSGGILSIDEGSNLNTLSFSTRKKSNRPQNKNYRSHGGHGGQGGHGYKKRRPR